MAHTLPPQAPVLPSRSRCRPPRARAPVAAATLEAQAPPAPAKMEPLGDRVLVKPLQRKEVTEGGLYMATGGAAANFGQDAELGVVLALGSDVDIGVKVQDTVLFSKYSTSEIQTEEGEVQFVAQKSILGTLSK